MGAIIIGSMLLGIAFGWRADMIANTTTTNLIWAYLLGGLGFAMLLMGILERIHVIIRGPEAVSSMFKRTKATAREEA